MQRRAGGLGGIIQADARRVRYGQMNDGGAALSSRRGRVTRGSEDRATSAAENMAKVYRRGRRRSFTIRTDVFISLAPRRSRLIYFIRRRFRS